MPYRRTSDIATITIAEKAGELYKLITGKEMPKLQNYDLPINSRTRDHAQKLCDSIEAQRKKVISYQP